MVPVPFVLRSKFLARGEHLLQHVPTTFSGLTGSIKYTLISLPLRAKYNLASEHTVYLPEGLVGKIIVLIGQS